MKYAGMLPAPSAWTKRPSLPVCFPDEKLGHALGNAYDEAAPSLDR
jgi:hypothetical protein